MDGFGLPPKANHVLISMARVKQGPPPPHATWNHHSILALLRSAHIDSDSIVNWSRAPSGAGYYIFYVGEQASEAMQQKLL